MTGELAEDLFSLGLDQIDTGFPVAELIGNAVSVHYLSFLFKPIDGKFIVDGINVKGAVPHIDIF